MLSVKLSNSLWSPEMFSTVSQHAWDLNVWFPLLGISLQIWPNMLQTSGLILNKRFFVPVLVEKEVHYNDGITMSLDVDVEDNEKKWARCRCSNLTLALA